MKRLVISVAAAASLTGLAHADVTVLTPKQPVSKEEAEAYVTKLDEAVKHVCVKAYSPIIGLNFYLYQECLKATRADVEKKDPTGIYASRELRDSTVFAAR